VPNLRPMAVAEDRFLLDTGAWIAVRRRRRLERIAPWALIAVAGLALVGLIWGGSLAVAALSERAAAAAAPAPPKVVPAPTNAETPVAVWNGIGTAGVAAEAARRLMLVDYPIVAVGDAPDRSFERTYVMYKVDDPAGLSAAKHLIKQLKLKDAVPTPMEGVGDSRISGARLLVIIADPLRRS
jgi:hypothetical protein